MSIDDFIASNVVDQRSKTGYKIAATWSTITDFLRAKGLITYYTTVKLGAHHNRSVYARYELPNDCGERRRGYPSRRRLPMQDVSFLTQQDRIVELIRKFITTGPKDWPIYKDHNLQELGLTSLDM